MSAHRDVARVIDHLLLLQRELPGKRDMLSETRYELGLRELREQGATEYGVFASWYGSYLLREYASPKDINTG